MTIVSWHGVEVKTIPARAAFSWLVDNYGPITVQDNNYSDMTIGNAEVWLQDEWEIMIEWAGFRALLLACLPHS